MHKKKPTQHQCLFTVFLLLLFGKSILVHAGSADEIQVYTDAINTPGAFGLELHSNYVPVGINQPAYQGDMPAQGTFRETSEFSYGLTNTWELGAYLPIIVNKGNTYVEGGKLRIKFLDHAGENIFYGINTEVGWVPKRSAPNYWNTEIRPILGYRSDNWLTVFNPVMGWALSGQDSWRPSFEPSIKVGRNVGGGYMLGFEHHTDLGTIDNISPLSQQSHVTYLAIDTTKANINFNFGVGHGWTQGSDGWTVKIILGLPVNQWFQ